jgi:hypothetical protein
MIGDRNTNILIGILLCIVVLLVVVGQIAQRYTENKLRDLKIVDISYPQSDALNADLEKVNPEYTVVRTGTLTRMRCPDNLKGYPVVTTPKGTNGTILKDKIKLYTYCTNFDDVHFLIEE